MPDRRSRESNGDADNILTDLILGRSNNIGIGEEAGMKMAFASSSDLLQLR